MRPLISVVVPVYNVELYLDACVESIVNQSYKNIEYVVIDGASTDGTTDIINSYGNKISLFISEPDHGIYDAMTKGLNHCSGDFVVFINSGDRLATPYIIE